MCIWLVTILSTTISQKKKNYEQEDIKKGKILNKCHNENCLDIIYFYGLLG